MNKKASMELGVNAIIILIIALAILGLSLSFVTGLFKGGQKKLGGLIDRVDMPIHADSTNPIIFDANEVYVKLQGDMSANVVVSVYNVNFAEGADISLNMDAGCIMRGETSVGNYFLITAPTQIITPGMDAGYKAIISATDTASDIPNTYICTVAATDRTNTVSQQIFVITTN